MGGTPWHQEGGYGPDAARAPSSIARGGRLQAQVSLGSDASGRRIRRSRTFDSREHAECWISRERAEHIQLTEPVTYERLGDYLRRWLAVEAPKGKPGRRPLARTTLPRYRVVIEHHLIPELGHRKVGPLTIRELDAFAGLKLAAGYAPATVNRMRETLRSALSTAVRQDRLIRNVARYGAGVAAVRPPVDRFTDHELALILKASGDEHFFPIILLLARTGLRPGEACGLRWRDLNLTSAPPRLKVVWQMDRWGELVHPKTSTSRRTIPLLAVSQQLADAVYDWWATTPPPIVYRTRSVPAARSIAFTRSVTWAHVTAGHLRDARALLVALVTHRGFDVPEAWL